MNETAATTTELELPPELPEYRLQVGDEPMRFFSGLPAGSVVYDCVNVRRYRLTGVIVEHGVFKAELVG